jgi:2-polyprenyl-3-methyl-5-hydroxy-6-metoxy-1,4-benzoquinol methylase
VRFGSDVVYARVVPGEDRLDPETVPGKIHRHVGSGQRVLDVGCGGGFLAMHLSRKGAIVTGIERNAEAAALARSHCARVIEGDIAAGDPLEPDERFDVIVCADVLEHVAAPDRVLGRLARHLGIDGCFLISLPNIAHYKIRLRLLAGRFDYEDAGILDRTHLRFFTRSTALAMIEARGLRPEVVDVVWGVPLGRLRRYWPRMQEILGPLAPDLFAVQWVIRASRP